VEAAKGFAELLDFGFGDVLFVLSPGELLADFVEVAKNVLERFADALDFLFRLKDPGTLFGGQIAVAGTAFLDFARGADVDRAVGDAVRRAVGLATRLITTTIAGRHAAIARSHATASAAATAARVTWTSLTRRTGATGSARTLILGTAFGGWTLTGFSVWTFVGRGPFVGFVRPVKIGTALARFVRLGF
jgi:hypothetical protein